MMRSIITHLMLFNHYRIIDLTCRMCSSVGLILLEHTLFVTFDIIITTIIIGIIIIIDLFKIVPCTKTQLSYNQNSSYDSLLKTTHLYILIHSSSSGSDW